MSLLGTFSRRITTTCLVGTLMAAPVHAALTSCANGGPPGPAGITVRVGLKYAPPFVLEDERGGWTGLSVELWEAVAACLGVKYLYFEYATTDELLDAVSKGEVDAGVSALSVTSEREQRVDFTHVYHVGSLGALVPKRSSENAVTGIVRRLSRPSVAGTALALLGATLLVAYGCWQLERRRGNLFFTEGPGSGFYQSWLWSVQLVFAGRGDPFSVKHRGWQLLVLFLTFFGATIVSGMTAVITSSLTLEGIDQRVHSLKDLKARTIGVMTTGRAREWALSERLVPVQLRSWPQVQRRLDEQAFDALLHDRDILEFLVKEQVLRNVRVEPLSFKPQSYAFAIRPGSELRKPINLNLLALRDSAAWAALENKYLGNE